MTEQVGTTTNFNMTVDEIIDFALEGIGGEHINHSEAKRARTALNLIFIDLQNTGVAPLASVRETAIELVSGSSEGYLLSGGVFNIMDGVIEVSNSSNSKTDLPLQRISYSDWLEIPTKESTKGRPTQFFVNRQRDNIELKFWPVPEKSNYRFKAWTLNRIADVDKSYQLMDVPHRYLPSIMKGLRYYMAYLRSGISLEEKAVLKQDYDQSLQLALSEDRERVGFSVYPSHRNILGS